MSHIFMSYCRHEQTLQALNECEWMDDLEQMSQAKIKTATPSVIKGAKAPKFERKIDNE